MKFPISRFYMPSAVLMLVAGLIFNPALAHSTDSHAGHHAHHHNQQQTLNPFSADYTLKKKGLTIGKIRLSLAREDNRWRFETHAEASGLAAMLSGGDTVTESTLLTAGDNGVLPAHYQYLRSGDKHGKDLKTQFNWQESVAEVTEQDTSTSVKLKDGTLNEHAVTVALILALKSGFAEKTYNVLDETKVETHTYTNAGEEKIKVPAGEFDAVKVVRKHGSRETVSWYSPTLNYLPIKVQSFKDGKLKSEMELLPVK